MTTTPTNRYAALDDSQQVWDLLCEKTDALLAAWAMGGEPELRNFLPPASPTVRRMMLAELIKVDLEHRWQDGRTAKRLEEYVAEFPELGSLDRLPCDLIYEEFHIRKQAGIEVDPQEYFARFPAQAPELIRLLGLEAPYLTTSCTGRESMAELEPGQRIDDFDLLVRLGRGAFATVYLARQVSMQRLVALKVTTSRSNEPQTLAQLDHPHIVRVFDQRVLAERKLRLLYMQYVPGGTLQAVADAVRRTPAPERRGQLLLEVIDRELSDRGETTSSDSRSRQWLSRASWAEAVCWLGARMAGALDYAHDRGVLHRDIKPANVLLGADAAPRLVDFNISFSSKLEGVSPAAYFGGSLAYMSPEQLEACNPGHDRRPDELDGRTDLYSLGVVLWELLSGSRPFDDRVLEGDRSATLSEMSERRRRGVPEAVFRALPADRPAGLDEILARCLAAEPGERFANGASLARQLELCLRPEAQRLLSPPRRRLQRFLRTLPGALATLILVGLLPNALLSALNIDYNSKMIVRWLDEPAQQAFWRQLVPVNAVFYGVSVAVGIYLHFRVLRGLTVPLARRATPRFSLPWLRRRTLAMGFFVALTIEAAWTISGVTFPWLLSRYVQPPGSLETWAWLHFLVSQVLCGLLAGTLAFFLISFVAIRFIYPLYIDHDSMTDEDLVPLARTRARTWWQTGLACLLPLVAVMLLVFAESDLSTGRRFFGSLGLLGLVATGVALTLLGVIQRDLQALATAIRPSGEGFGVGSEALESSWNTTRR